MALIMYQELCNYLRSQQPYGSDNVIILILILILL